MTDAPASSWILELRSRLAPEDDAKAEASEPSVAVFVPLFVGPDGLMTVLTLGETLPPDGLRRVRFPSVEIEPGDGLWQAAAEIAAEQLGVEPGKVLRLGVMQPFHSSSRYGLGPRPLVPVLGAVPRFDLAESGAGPDAEVDLVTLSLSRLRSPHGVETGRVELANGVEEVPVRAVDGVRLWGPAAEVLDRLMELLAPAN